MYKPGSTLEQEFVLNLEAVPAEAFGKSHHCRCHNILGDHDESDDCL